MNFKDLSQLRSEGFQGFKTKQELFINDDCVPKVKGVYLVLSNQKKSPVFLAKGSGGFFKGKDPNVPIMALDEKWVKNVLTIYIGKAGGDSSKATLHSRLRQYFRFGQGKNVGHWGGRYIWQLEHHLDLLVCWKPLPDEDPATVETSLIHLFIAQYGKLPFANLK
jgi:hypothetical protein